MSLFFGIDHEGLYVIKPAICFAIGCVTAGFGLSHLSDIRGPWAPCQGESDAAGKRSLYDEMVCGAWWLSFGFDPYAELAPYALPGGR